MSAYVPLAESPTETGDDAPLLRIAEAYSLAPGVAGTVQGSPGGAASSGAAPSSSQRTESGKTFGARADQQERRSGHVEKERGAREKSGEEPSSASLRRRRPRTSTEGDHLQCQVCALKCSSTA